MTPSIRATSFVFCLLSGAFAPPTATATAMADEAEQAEQSCLSEVRTALIEGKSEPLDSETAQSVRDHCKRGDTKGALALLNAGDSQQPNPQQSCVREINNRLKRSGQDLSREILAEAHRRCRSGDLEAALAVIDGAISTAPTAAPAVLSFTADRAVFQENESVTLTWKTSNANEVFLARVDPDAPTGISDRKPVQASGSAKVTPPGTSTYLLTALGSGAQPKMDQRKLLLRVDAAPNIFRFQAYPTTIRAGESAELSWDVYGAEQVRLDQQDVDARGDRTVKPTRKTYYKLTAWSSSEETAKKSEEVAAVSVSPFPRARLGSAIARIDLCRELETSGGSARCISSDGPFWSSDEIQVMVRFGNLSSGRHTIARTFYRGTDYGSQGWRILDRESSGFDNPSPGDALATFAIPRLGKGILKLEIVLDGDPGTRSEIKFCVECPGHDEW